MATEFSFFFDGGNCWIMVGKHFIRAAGFEHTAQTFLQTLHEVYLCIKNRIPAKGFK
jgi:hypothetical protein